MLDKIITILIIIMYNLFVHHLASMIFKNLSLEKKYTKSVILILVMGIIGIILGNMLKSNIVISNGLFYGGCILIVTGVIINWNKMTDQLKLILSGGLLISLIWFAKEKLNSNKNIKSNIKPDKHTTNTNTDPNIDSDTESDIDSLIDNSL